MCLTKPLDCKERSGTVTADGTRELSARPGPSAVPSARGFFQPGSWAARTIVTSASMLGDQAPDEKSPGREELASMPGPQRLCPKPPSGLATAVPTLTSTRGLTLATPGQ